MTTVLTGFPLRSQRAGIAPSLLSVVFHLVAPSRSLPFTRSVKGRSVACFFP